MGYKKVSFRHNDVLANMPWDEFERLMARHYAARGFRVEHSGTGANASRRGFDGGIDLKLYRGDEYILVQCKRYTERQVTHNVVHELIGVMQTQRASGGIVVNSGEFTAFAIESAAKYPNITLVDGIELRRMLAATGDLPTGSAPDEILASLAGGDRRRQGRRSSRRNSRRPSVLVTAVSFVILVAAMFFVYQVYIPRVLQTMTRPVTHSTAPVRPPTSMASVADVAPAGPATTGAPPPKPALTRLSKKESDAWDKKNAESMRILEKTTPSLD